MIALLIELQLPIVP